MNLKLTTKQLAFQVARDLRKRQTNAEKIFWALIRGKRIKEYKFQRQFPIFYEYYGTERFFIADFYCAQKKLVVEIDGGVHEAQEDYDKIRTEILNLQKDIRVIRFKNNDIFHETEYVIQKLLDSLK